MGDHNTVGSLEDVFVPLGCNIDVSNGMAGDHAFFDPGPRLDLWRPCVFINISLIKRSSFDDTLRREYTRYQLASLSACLAINLPRTGMIRVGEGIVPQTLLCCKTFAVLSVTAVIPG